MKRVTAFICLAAMTVLSSCTKQETPAPAAEAPSASAPAAAPAEPAAGPRATVHLKDGKRETGTIVASSKTDMIVAGDDGIERKIPLGQIKSVDYGTAKTASAARPAAPAPARPSPAAPKTSAPSAPETKAESDRPLTPAAPASAPVRAVTTKTYELPAGSEISVRTNEEINS